MPDSRRHRGKHPDDDRLFSPAEVPAMREAVSDLSWLLTRGYAIPSSLKLAGDRYQLKERQRTAVLRSSCSDKCLQERKQRQLNSAALAGQCIAVDGFNLLTTVEVALSGGILIRGRDGCVRDMASMHGTYRVVAETRPALAQIAECLSKLKVASVLWLFDRPVSNSGRLSRLVNDMASEHDWPWVSELHDNPDHALMTESQRIVVSADSVVIENCHRWFDLASELLHRLPSAVVIDLGTPNVAP